jgi:hypothetical protein
MKEGQGGQGTGPPHPGRLSHCYRCDNITLHSDTFAHAPKGSYEKLQASLRRQSLHGSLCTRQKLIRTRAKKCARTPTSCGVPTNGRRSDRSPKVGYYTTR